MFVYDVHMIVLRISIDFDMNLVKLSYGFDMFLLIIQLFYNLQTLCSCNFHGFHYECTLIVM